MASPRRHRSPPTLMEDLVEEILLRLPPDEPACRVRAALVCKSWLRVLHDGVFLRRYRKFHRKPSLLGFIHNGPGSTPGFVSTSNAFPFAFPSSLQLAEAPNRSSWALDCRHDRVLILQGFELIVWDPITNEEHHLALPSYPDDLDHSHAAVLCAADGCDHLDCHGGPYNVVFVGTQRFVGEEYVAWASVYSSETGAWSAVTSTTIEFDSYVEMKPSLLIGDTLYFTLSQSGMLKFDLEGRSLSLIYSPGVFGAIPMMAEDGGLEFTAVLEDSIYTWSWQAATQNSTARWVQQWIMELELMLPSCHPSTSREVIGLVEGTHTIFIDSPRVGVLTLDLKSRQVRRVGEAAVYYDILPYRSFYIPDLAKAG